MQTSNIDAPATHVDTIVAGVGASAGGLGAFKQLLRSIPDQSDVAFVLIQHLDPTHDSLMVDLLRKYTSMPVIEVQDGMSVEPNHVYMIPPNQFIQIANGRLHLERPVTQRGVRLPIDHFFRSLAEAHQERAICVVLSGTGSDGSEGLREVKAAGGVTIVQQPETAEHDGMPRAAINTGCADYVLPISDMASAIVPYAKHPYVRMRPRTLADDSPEQLRTILSLLRAHTDHDFSRYKQGTLTRRIQRRMSVRQVSEAAEYVRILREDRNEIQALFKDMLIGVTSFFRDANAWDDLSKILSQSIRERAKEAFRVWVPGCATGEEAYTIAMLLEELKPDRKERFEFQVFATDIDSEAIQVARQGLYSINLSKDVREDRLDQHFQREGEQLRVRKRLRESCVFAVQNVLSDPPFSNLDLICCRNLLIYLESDVQRRLFEIMHFSLRSSGLLFLGNSESLAKRKHLFETVSQVSRIYRKVGHSKLTLNPIHKRNKEQSVSPGEAAEEEPDFRSRIGTGELSKRALLDEYVPASVVVNERGTIHYIHGPVREYLDFPSGEPSLDLAEIALAGLKAKIRTSLRQARTTGGAVSLIAPRVRRDGGYVRVRLRVVPLPAQKGHDELFLVSFWDDSELQSRAVDWNPAVAESMEDVDPTSEIDDHQLALELQSTKEDLQSTIEELESANEELKASNEEVMSMNEELQSTNEELETSREELQSLNEELSTLNNQLQDKVDELEATTNDLQNLLTSTDMATLFLDHELRIRRYTPATSRLINIIESDIGRSLDDLSTRVKDPKVVSDARQVLEDLSPVEREVRSGEDRWYMRRIMPFRTSDNRIEGVVITFSDITKVKSASNRLALRESQQAVVAKLGRDALASSDLRAFFKRVAHEIADTLNVRYAKILRLVPNDRHFKLLAGVGWRAGVVGKARIPAGVNSQAGFTLQSTLPVIVKDLPSEKRFSGPELLVEHGIVSGISVIIGTDREPWGVLGVHSEQQIQFTADDTNFIQAVANLLWEAIQRESVERRFRALVNASSQIVWTTDAAGHVAEDSLSWREFTGQLFEEFRGSGWIHALHPDDRERVKKQWQRAVETRRPLTIEYRLRHRDGTWHWTEVNAVPLTEFDGTVGGWVGMNTDISNYKEAEEHRGRLAAIIESSQDAIIGKSLDGIISSWNVGAEQLYGYRAEEMIGESVGRLMPDDRPSELSEILSKVKAGEAIHHFETVRKCKDGSLRDVSLTISPVRNSLGHIVGASAIARDVTDRKQMEKRLAEAKLAAEAASEAKSTFLANMSHEIRTPMTAILGYADILSARLSDQDARACLRTIKENGEFLCDIINDILDLSKIESGKMTVRREEASLVQILADVRSLMTLRATEKLLTLSVDFDGMIPDRVMTDPKMVRQVLVNLVGNAIKFTEQGGIRITCRCFRDRNLAEIEVEDTGVGISKENIENLFKPFEQLDNSFTRSASGSGLGLAISDKLVDMLDGELSVESELGEGSVFRFTFATGPLQNANWFAPNPEDLRSTLSEVPESALPRLPYRILAADDRREIRYLVRSILESVDATVDVVEDGVEAVDAYLECQRTGQEYDAILLDMQMPNMDGLEAARRLRAEGFRGPLITLTANAMNTDREKCLEAGYDDFVAKPIDRNELVSALAKWIEKQADDAENPRSSHGVVALLVDPSISSDQSVAVALRQRGHDVHVASSGHHAFEILAETTPDAVIMAMELNEMSGMELLTQMKTKPELAQCRFICYSDNSESETSWRAMGFDLFLLRPADVADMDKALRTLSGQSDA